MLLIQALELGIWPHRGQAWGLVVRPGVGRPGKGAGEEGGLGIMGGEQLS